MLLLYVILLGMVTSYTDIKFRKIKNKHLLLILSFALLTYIFLIVTKQLTVNITLFLNPLIGLFIGVIFYLTHVWAAGDAKLFFVYCCLVLSNKGFGVIHFSSIIILMNIFLAGTLCVGFISIIRMYQKKEGVFQKKQAGIFLQRFFYVFLILFSFGWFVFGFFKRFTNAGDSFLSIIILYGLYFLIMRIVNANFSRKIIFLILLLLIVLRFYADPLARNFSNLLAYLKGMFVITFIFTLGNKIADDVKGSKERIAFAPIMFLGVLLYFTDFLFVMIKVLNFLKGIA